MADNMKGALEGIGKQKTASALERKLAKLKEGHKGAAEDVGIEIPKLWMGKDAYIQFLKAGSNAAFNAIEKIRQEMRQPNRARQWHYWVKIRCMKAQCMDIEPGRKAWVLVPTKTQWVEIQPDKDLILSQGPLGLQQQDSGPGFLYNKVRAAVDRLCYDK